MNLQRVWDHNYEFAEVLGLSLEICSSFGIKIQICNTIMIAAVNLQWFGVEQETKVCSTCKPAVLAVVALKCTGARRKGGWKY